MFCECSIFCKEHQREDCPEDASSSSLSCVLLRSVSWHLHGDKVICICSEDYYLTKHRGLATYNTKQMKLKVRVPNMHRGLLSAKESIHRISSHRNRDSMAHPISDTGFPCAAPLWALLDPPPNSGPQSEELALSPFLSPCPCLPALTWAASIHHFAQHSQFWTAVQALCLELAPSTHPPSFLIPCWADS